MENNKHEKVSFYEVAKDFENMIDYHINQLHIRQPYDEYFQEGLYTLWKVYQMHDAKVDGFSIFASNEIRYRLLIMKREESSLVSNHNFINLGLKQQALNSIHNPCESIQSKLMVNQWKWMYQFILLDGSGKE